MAKHKEQVEGQEQLDAAAGEMHAAGDETNLGAPTAEEAAAEAQDTRTWEVDGATVTKSEFIRHQFTTNNLSRKQISEQFDINYRTVYGATVNMVNGAEPSTRGRTASATKIKVTADGHVVSVIENVYHIDNVAVEDAAGQEAEASATEVDRNTWVKEQVTAGRERGDIAKALGMSYGVIYGMTKDIAGSTQRHEYQVEGADGNPETITRSEYIRRLHAAGKGKSEIAKELGVDYPVVWSALKGLKSEEDKYSDAVERVAKFAENVVDADAFNALIEQLKAVAFKQDAAPAPEAEAPAAESPYQDGAQA